MTKEEAIKRLESIKETFETFAYGLDDIYLDIEALEYAIENLKDKKVPTNSTLEDDISQGSSVGEERALEGFYG